MILRPFGIKRDVAKTAGVVIFWFSLGEVVLEIWQFSAAANKIDQLVNKVVQQVSCDNLNIFQVRR
jgi:hypothetical protein